MKGRKHNIPMCMALVLLCLTMLTTHLTGGLYARYTTTATGSDGAKVAKFDVQCTITPVGGTSDQFTVKVTNASEVTVSYKLQVEPGQGTPAMKVKFDTLTEGVTGATFSNNWELTPGAERDHTLTLGMKTFDGTFTRDPNPFTEESVDMTFFVNVMAEQLD